MNIYLLNQLIVANFRRRHVLRKKKNMGVWEASKV